MLSRFDQFRPRTRVFTNENGISELLLCIYGTLQDILPVPLLLWIPRSYPLVHPLIYLDLEQLEDSRPSVGDYVNPNGLISLPIFSRWSADTNNILQVIQEAAGICQYNCFLRPSGAPMQDSIDPRTLPPQGTSRSPDLPIKPPRPPSISLPLKSASTSTSDIPPVSSKVPLAESDYNNTVSPPPVPPKPPTKALDVITNIDLLDTEIANYEDPLYHKALLKLQWKVNELCLEDEQLLQKNLYNRKDTVKSAVAQFERMLDYESLTHKSVSDSIRVRKTALDKETANLAQRSKDIEEYERQNGCRADILSLIVAESVMINQLYELVAKDCAISDTIHALSRLLCSESIKLDSFVKKTRELARQQFLTRMQIQKVGSIIDSGTTSH